MGTSHRARRAPLRNFGTLLILAAVGAGCGGEETAIDGGTGSASASATPATAAATRDASATGTPETGRPAPETLTGERPDFEGLKKPTVRLTEVTIEPKGAGEKETVRAGLDSLGVSLSRCYADRRAAKPGLRGSVTLTLTVGADGLRRAVAHSGEDAGLERCFGGLIDSWLEAGGGAPGITLRATWSLYGGLSLPATMPSLPPPPPLGRRGGPKATLPGGGGATSAPRPGTEKGMAR